MVSTYKPIFNIKGVTCSFLFVELFKNVTKIRHADTSDLIFGQDSVLLYNFKLLESTTINRRIRKTVLNEVRCKNYFRIYKHFPIRLKKIAKKIQKIFLFNVPNKICYIYTIKMFFA